MSERSKELWSLFEYDTIPLDKNVVDIGSFCRIHRS